MEAITSFSGDHSFLSNFSPHKVLWLTVPGGWCPTAEHAYQASKTPELKQKITISKLATPGQAKRAGKLVRLHADWEDVKLLVMEGIVTSKFKQNPAIMNKLIETGTAQLVEGNRWHDNFWGDCSCDRCKDIEGLNHLGKILMKIRDDIIKE